MQDYNDAVLRYGDACRHLALLPEVLHERLKTAWADSIRFVKLEYLPSGDLRGRVERIAARFEAWKFTPEDLDTDLQLASDIWELHSELETAQERQHQLVS